MSCSGNQPTFNPFLCECVCQLKCSNDQILSTDSCSCIDNPNNNDPETITIVHDNNDNNQKYIAFSLSSTMQFVIIGMILTFVALIMTKVYCFGSKNNGKGFIEGIPSTKNINVINNDSDNEYIGDSEDYSDNTDQEP